MVAPARRSTPTPRRYLPRSLGLLDEPVLLERGDQPEGGALVDAELGGDLGDAGLADPGQDLEDAQRAVDGLDAGATVGACRVDLRGLPHGRRLAHPLLRIADCVSPSATTRPLRPTHRQALDDAAPSRTSGDATAPAGDFVLVLSCPDRPGIVHAVSGFLRRARRQHPREPAVRRPAVGPVLHADRLRDARRRRTSDALRADFAPVADRVRRWSSSCGRPGRRTGR